VKESTARRQFLKGLAGTAAAIPFSGAIAALAATPARAKPQPTFSPEDDQLLDDLERASCCYFWEQAGAQTGLVKDRCNARKAALVNFRNFRHALSPSITVLRPPIILRLQIASGAFITVPETRREPLGTTSDQLLQNRG